MKEFEKWQDKEHINVGIWTTAARNGWKAALRYVLSTGYIDDYGDEILDSRQIRKELEE